jgi:hypothetical protein
MKLQIPERLLTDSDQDLHDLLHGEGQDHLQDHETCTCVKENEVGQGKDFRLIKSLFNLVKIDFHMYRIDQVKTFKRLKVQNRTVQKRWTQISNHLNCHLKK